MGTPQLTSLGWSRRPSRARGVKRGGSQRAEFGSGGERCQPLSPHKEGVTIGTTPRGTGGAGGGDPGQNREMGGKWKENRKKMERKREENGKGGVENTTPGLSEVLKINQNERKLEGLSIQLRAGSASS